MKTFASNNLLTIFFSLIAVGGDFEAGNGTTRVAGYSLDDGETWLPASTQPSGYR